MLIFWAKGMRKPPRAWMRKKQTSKKTSPKAPLNPPPRVELPVNSPPQQKRRFAQVKTWAWRLTAFYAWLHSVLVLANGRDILAGAEHATSSALVSLLSSAGFAPTNAASLPLVLIGIWLLAITEFSPL